MASLAEIYKTMKQNKERKSKAFVDNRRMIETRADAACMRILQQIGTDSSVSCSCDISREFEKTLTRTGFHVNRCYVGERRVEIWRIWDVFHSTRVPNYETSM